MLRGMGGCQNVGMSIHKLSLPFEKLFIVPEQPHPGKHAHHAYYSRRSADKGNKRRNDHSGYSIPHWRGIVAPAVAFTTKKEDAEVVRMDAPAEMWMLIDECNQHHGRTSHFYVFTFSKRKDALAFKNECNESNESSDLIDVSGTYKMYQTKG